MKQIFFFKQTVIFHEHKALLSTVWEGMWWTDFIETLPNSCLVAIKDASFPPRLLKGVITMACRFWFPFRGDTIFLSEMWKRKCHKL